jgi:hypothetical protein
MQSSLPETAPHPRHHLDAYTIVRAMNPNPKPGVPLQPARLPTSNQGSPESSCGGSVSVSRMSSLNGILNEAPSSAISHPAQPFSPLRPSMAAPAPAHLNSTPINSPLRPSSIAILAPATLNATGTLLKEPLSLNPLSPAIQLRKKRLSSSRFSSDGSARESGALPALQTFHHEDGSTFTDRLSPASSLQLPLQFSPPASHIEALRTSAPTHGTLESKGLSLLLRPPTPVDLSFGRLSSSLDDTSLPPPSGSSSSGRTRFISMSGAPPKAGRRSQVTLEPTISSTSTSLSGLILIGEARLPVSSSSVSRVSDGSQERKSTPNLRPSQPSPAYLPLSPASSRALPMLSGDNGKDSLSSFMTGK